MNIQLKVIHIYFDYDNQLFINPATKVNMHCKIIDDEF